MVDDLRGNVWTSYAILGAAAALIGLASYGGCTYFSKDKDVSSNVAQSVPVDQVDSGIYQNENGVLIFAKDSAKIDLGENNEFNFYFCCPETVYVVQNVITNPNGNEEKNTVPGGRNTTPKKDSSIDDVIEPKNPKSNNSSGDKKVYPKAPSYKNNPVPEKEEALEEACQNIQYESIFKKMGKQDSIQTYNNSLDSSKVNYQ